jgi:hypothetical protein
MAQQPPHTFDVGDVIQYKTLAVPFACQVLCPSGKRNFMILDSMVKIEMNSDKSYGLSSQGTRWLWTLIMLLICLHGNMHRKIQPLFLETAKQFSAIFCLYVDVKAGTNRLSLLSSIIETPSSMSTHFFRRIIWMMYIQISCDVA